MNQVTKSTVGIIGGGLSGLTAAIRAAQQGFKVEIFEAAPQLGGRTNSFFHQPTQSWVDHGPHLLIGAYQRSKALLEEAGAWQCTDWQKTLTLPLWQQQRGHFSLNTSAYLPFPLALIQAVFRMPGHGFQTLPSLLRLAKSMQIQPDGSVSDWMEQQKIHPNLQQDMLEVLCLGAMNEPMQTAHAASFALLLKQAFSSHEQAHLGWFTKPLSQALIAPLEQYALQLGVSIHRSCRVLSYLPIADQHQLTTRSGHFTFDHIILASSPAARNTLLNIKQDTVYNSITNIHLWFKENISLPSPFIGGIGTYGQWFFDISKQFKQPHQPQQPQLSHLCAVISADSNKQNNQAKIETVCKELQKITSQPHLKPIFQKLICVKQATNLVRDYKTFTLPQGMIDACEQPALGALPATIEAAIIRGEQAALALLKLHPSQ
ncbi:MAG: FAD-dependent oxidoreductase [Mariprofundaceae bacterium]